jgi:hypothetical protein
LWGFFDATRLVEVARLAVAACFDEAARFDKATCEEDLLCLGEPLKMSDNQPALLAPIGRSTNAAIAAMTMRQREAPRPEDAKFLTDDGNPCFPQNVFPFAPRGKRQH